MASSGSESQPGDLSQPGPVARMMMSVAAHAITSYVQFRALAEVLIQRGLITREELEAQFAAMRDQQLDVTVEEWFPPDIAYHLKMAIRAAQAEDDQAGADGAPSVAVPEPDEVARARAMQDGTQPPRAAGDGRP